MSSGLSCFTIYASPRDFPGLYVLREHVCADGESIPAKEPRCVSRSLEDVRAAIPPGLWCVGRSQSDEPQILETWL